MLILKIVIPDFENGYLFTSFSNSQLIIDISQI